MSSGHTLARVTRARAHFQSFALFAPGILAAGCVTSPPIPYTEPAAEVPVAHVRLITNGDVAGAPFAGCPVNGTLMAQAGRFKNDVMSFSYPQYPSRPSSLDMSPRAMPPLLEYMSPTRMANGPYREVATEYRIPAGVPFAFHFSGATAGGFSSTHLICPRRTGVFQFEAGEHYDVSIGMMAREIDGKQQVICVMAAARLLSIPGSEISLPFPLAQVNTDEPNCKK